MREQRVCRRIDYGVLRTHTAGSVVEEIQHVTQGQAPL